jgi:hypothetical protein
MSKTRKGQVVALEIKRVTYFQNPYRHETRIEYDLVEVASATRDGIVKTFRQAGCNYVNRLDAFHGGRPRVLTIGTDDAASVIQTKAQRLFASLEISHPAWDSAEALKAAVLNA